MDATLHRMERDERADALARIHQLIEQFGFLPFEVYPRKNNEPKAKLPAKYYDPDSGQSWSGRGKPPRWIEGKSRAQFLIQKDGLLAAMESAGVLSANDAGDSSDAEQPSHSGPTGV
jgi:DNA-binding protein H-NS